MTENQKLRYELVKWKADIEEAKKAYAFIMGEDESNEQVIQSKMGGNLTTPLPVELPDGIYVVYEDGKREHFNGKNSTENVSHIGIKLGYLSLGMKLNSLGEQSLPKTSHDAYITSTDEAVQDFSGYDNTQRLKAAGLDFDLQDDEWLPSIGELLLIFYHKKPLNEVLAYLGGDELINDWYWSSTEYGSNIAWHVSFSGGNVGSCNKTNSYVVRPVCAF